ncbi:MAG: hypothetical protein QM817_06605 [Archangium sp.]
MKRFAFSLLFFSLTAFGTPPMNAKSVTIVFEGDNGGEVSPCG